MKSKLNKRYYRQHDNYSCGPTAIFNVLRYYNPEYPFRKLRHIRKPCKLDPKYGTLNKDLRVAMTQFIPRDIQRTELKFPSYYQLKERLKRGPVLVEHRWEDEDGTVGEHYFVVLSGNGRRFTVVNFDNRQKEPVQEITFRELKVALRHHVYADKFPEKEDNEFPKAWCFERV